MKVMASYLPSYRKGETEGIKFIQVSKKNLRTEMCPFHFPTSSDEPPDINEPRKGKSFKARLGQPNDRSVS